jgi:hypothetical protein
VDGVPVTAVARTLIDLAEVTDPGELAGLATTTRCSAATGASSAHATCCALALP